MKIWALEHLALGPIENVKNPYYVIFIEIY